MLHIFLEECQFANFVEKNVYFKNNVSQYTLQVLQHILLNNFLKYIFNLKVSYSQQECFKTLSDK